MEIKHAHSLDKEKHIWEYAPVNSEPWRFIVVQYSTVCLTNIQLMEMMKPWGGLMKDAQDTDVCLEFSLNEVL